MNIEAQRAYPASEAEFEANRYPTLESQIRRAEARVEAAQKAAARRRNHWRTELAFARQRAPDEAAYRAIAGTARGIHQPHIDYHEAEAANWQAHLDKLRVQLDGRKAEEAAYDGRLPTPAQVERDEMRAAE